MFGEYGKAAGAKLAELYSQLLCALQALATATRDVESGTTGTARSLAYQFGVPPAPGAPGTGRLAPRSMVSLPIIVEQDVTEQTKIDLYEMSGRYVSSGFYANLSLVPLRVALLGVDGTASSLHTLPPGATVQLSCFLAGLIVEPGDEGEGRVQVYVS